MLAWVSSSSLTEQKDAGIRFLIRFDMLNVLGGNWDPTDKRSVQ